MRPAARVLSSGVRGYQRLFGGRVSPCRHVPSCSIYALEALEGHGAVRGSWLATKRLCRCHPWGTQGYDPVPGPVLGNDAVPPAPGAIDV